MSDATPEQAAAAEAQLVNEEHARAEAAVRRADQLANEMRRINDNALSWHAGEDGKARALNVISAWSGNALRAFDAAAAKETT